MMDKKHFDRKLSELIGHGFLFDPIWARWERVRAGKTERIGIGYNKYPGSYYIKGMGASLIFDEVENILQTVLNQYKIDKVVGNETIQKILFKIEGVDYTKLKQEIHDEASYESACIEMQKLVKEGAMPFFEKYQTLEDVFIETEQKPLSELVHFIGQPLPQRRMVIKKLCHDPNYTQYVNELITYYKSENNTLSLFFTEKLDEYLNQNYG